jgi:hypothetical protein
MQPVAGVLMGVKRHAPAAQQENQQQGHAPSR